MTFFEYMQLRNEENNYIGDLARDMAEDPDLPKTDNPMDLLRYFMIERKLSDPARRALRDAWREYREFDQIECRVRIALQECRSKCLGHEWFKFPDAEVEVLAAQCALSILDIK